MVSYTEKHLSSAFSRHAPNRPVLQRAFCGTGPNLYKKLLPSFSSFSPTVTSLVSSSSSPNTMLQYMEPMYELMARQQFLLESQQQNQDKQKEVESGQQNSIVSQQSALIKDMFSSFEGSFKTMMEAMTSMMTANSMALQNAATQNLQNMQPKQVDKPKTPAVFTKAVPIVRARKARTANDPVLHVQLDPDTGKISRQSTE